MSRIRTETLRQKFADLDANCNYVICDGYLLYYNDEVAKQFDVKLFVREDYSVLKERRENRSGYVRSPLS